MQNNVTMARLHPDLIRVTNRLRGLNEETVVRLVESIRQLGLQTAISVRWCPDEVEDYSADLIAGNHRLEACKRLGMEFVDVAVHDGTETDARLWEIAENLHRAELSALERADHVKKWRDLTLEAHARQPDANENRRADGRGHRPEGGNRLAARSLGLSEPDVRRAVKIADLHPDAKQAARDAGLSDNRTALLAATRVAPEQQAEAVRNYKKDLAEESWRRELLTVWNRGKPEWRARAPLMPHPT